MILNLNYKIIKKTVLSMKNFSKCMQTLSNNLWLLKIYFQKGKKKKKLKKLKKQA